MSNTSQHLLFAACGADGVNRGIRAFTWDESAGTLEPRESSGPETPDSVGSLGAHPEKPVLYAARDEGGQDAPSGRVMAFAYNPDGTVAALGSQSTEGSTPCYVSVMPDGKHLLVANFRYARSDRPSRGSVAIYPLDDRGAILELLARLEHEGSSKHPERQTNSHPHAVVPNPDHEAPFFAVCDLGTDLVYIYRMTDAGPELAHKEPFPALTGPRHAVFDPEGENLYVITEMSNRIYGLSFDKSSGKTAITWDCSILPESQGGSAADIVYHASSGTIYGSNRGHESIVTVRDRQAVGWVEEAIANARSMILSPGGGFLLVGNKGNDTISIHPIAENGELSEAVRHLPVKSPGPFVFRQVGV